MWGRNYYHKKNWSEILIFNRLKWENYFKADFHIFWRICRGREDAMRVSTCTVTQFSQTLNCVLPFGCPKSNFDSLLRGIASLYQLHSRQFWFEPSLSHITSIRSLQDKISLKTCVFRFRGNHKNVWVRKSRNFWLSISVISEWAINICNNAIIVEKLFLFVNSDLKLKSVFVPSDFIYSIDWLI